MTTLTYALGDSATMLRRNLERAVRYPALTVIVAAMPVVFLLLFVFVFGGTLGAGLGGASGGRAEYVNYVTPGILILGVAGAAQGTAIAVAMDMTEGIIARFRTMSIARASVLTGHVLAASSRRWSAWRSSSAWRCSSGSARRERRRVARGDRRPGHGQLRAVWLSVAMGLSAKSVESASNLPMLLILLPFFGSGFVPTESMPAGLRIVRRAPAVHADHRHPARAPARRPDRQQRVLAVAWCAGIAPVGYLWARRNYERRPAR